MYTHFLLDVVLWELYLQVHNFRKKSIIFRIKIRFRSVRNLGYYKLSKMT